MSDWQIGDLAVCVDADPSGIWYEQAGDDPDPAFGPRLGEINRVVWHGMDEGVHALRFEDYPAPGDSYASNCFRKILPDEQQACEPEFITLLKRSKRKVPA